MRFVCFLWVGILLGQFAYGFSCLLCMYFALRYTEILPMHTNTWLYTGPMRGGGGYTICFLVIRNKERIGQFSIHPFLCVYGPKPRRITLRLYRPTPNQLPRQCAYESPPGLCLFRVRCVYAAVQPHECTHPLLCGDPFHLNVGRGTGGRVFSSDPIREAVDRSICFACVSGSVYLFRFHFQQPSMANRSEEPKQRPRAKRSRKDPFQLEPSYVSIPLLPVILYDVKPGSAEELPRLPQRSVRMLKCEGERGLLEPFTCGMCRDVSTTTSYVPCLCDLLCDACKRLSHDPSYVDGDGKFGCKLCGAEYTPKPGYETCPPMSIHNHRIAILFQFVVTRCTVNCHFCSEQYPSVQALNVHMQDCAKDKFTLCRSISCLQPVNPDVPHVCMYNEWTASGYAEAPPLPLLVSARAFLYAPPPPPPSIIPLQGFFRYICSQVRQAFELAPSVLYGGVHQNDSCSNLFQVLHQNLMELLEENIVLDDGESDAAEDNSAADWRFAPCVCMQRVCACVCVCVPRFHFIIRAQVHSDPGCNAVTTKEQVPRLHATLQGQGGYIL
jgi:hypothetical protein